MANLLYVFFTSPLYLLYICHSLWHIYSMSSRRIHYIYSTFAIAQAKFTLGLFCIYSISAIAYVKSIFTLHMSYSMANLLFVFFSSALHLLYICHSLWQIYSMSSRRIH